MRLLIEALRNSTSRLSAYGMTHMHQLALRAADDERSQEFVSIMASDQHSYFIKYLMPEAQAPWPFAWVQGEANSVDEAAAMVLTAIRLSEGWALPTPTQAAMASVAGNLSLEHPTDFNEHKPGGSL